MDDAELYARWRSGDTACDCMGSVCEDPFVCGDPLDGELGCQCPVCG